MQEQNTQKHTQYIECRQTVLWQHTNSVLDFNNKRQNNFKHWSMYQNNHKENQGYVYHRISLPKPGHSQLQSTSTRCISVSKNDNKPSVLNSSLPNKNITQPKQLSYYLGKGNNDDLIRRVLNCRALWHESEDSTSAFINLKWQQDQKGFKYERLVDSGLCRSVYNQFQFHEALSNKQMLFRNLEHYCQKNNLDVWRIVPPTYLLNIRDECNMQLLKQFTDSYQKYYPKDLKQKGTQSDADIQQNKLKLRRLFCNANLKKILPKAPPITNEFIDDEGAYLWIVKPTFLNRGRGIQVFSKLQTLYKFISDNIQGYAEKSLTIKQEQESPKRIDYVKRNSEQIHHQVLMRDPANRQLRQKKEETFFDGNQYIRVIPKGPSIIKTDRFLIQKYLEKPMLIKSRKFDIRIWVLVTYGLKGYVFKEGYVRLSSLQYACTDSPDKNTFMHLTNNAVQRFSEGYGSVADGNQLSFKDLKDEMDKIGLCWDDCLKTIHEHIRVTLKATCKLLNPMNRRYSFQIYGYDFMIDKKGYPWLIQVNTNPCLEESSKLLASLIPRMVDDAFRLTLDPLFYGSVSSGKFKVEGYPDSQSLWVNLNVS